MFCRLNHSRVIMKSLLLLVSTLMLITQAYAANSEAEFNGPECERLYRAISFTKAKTNLYLDYVLESVTCSFDEREGSKNYSCEIIDQAHKNFRFTVIDPPGSGVQSS